MRFLSGHEELLGWSGRAQGVYWHSCLPVKDVARCSWLGSFDFCAYRMVSRQGDFLPTCSPAAAAAFEAHL